MAAILFTGGARSGKSLLAENRTLSLSGTPVYIATAEALDAGMAARIAAHRARRDARWRDVAAPLDLTAALAATEGQGARLVDCLTLWLSNLMAAGRDWQAEGTTLAAALQQARSPVVLVTGEVGMGIVPDNALARDYRDALGWLNQTVAAVADEVILTVAGQALRIK